MAGLVLVALALATLAGGVPEEANMKHSCQDNETSMAEELSMLQVPNVHAFETLAREVTDEARPISHESLLMGVSMLKAPLAVTETVNFAPLGFGNTTYPGKLIPDPYQPLLPTSTQSSTFEFHWNRYLDRRIGQFSQTVSAQPNTTNASAFAANNQAHAQSITDASAPVPFTQGGNDVWQTDQFAADLLGHTLAAALLEASTGGDFVLDLSGTDKGQHATDLQQLKTSVVQTAPNDMLRCRGVLRTVDRRPELVRIDVLIPAASATSEPVWMEFRPNGSQMQWGVAKVALHVITLYTIECFHTGIHLYSALVMSALQLALPLDAMLTGMVDPQAVFVITAMLEQASKLHSDHDSDFSGAVWDADIVAVRATTANIAVFFFDSGPLEVLGITENGTTPAWWAGMAAEFIPPIQAFAAGVASQVLSQKGSTKHLNELQKELTYVGILQPGSSVDVTKQPGLAKLYQNMLFVQGICHTHMYSTREALTLLAGFPSSTELVPMLSDRAAPLSLVQALDVSYPELSGQRRRMAELAFGTTSGFAAGVPELSDGPFLHTNAVLNASINAFQRSISVAREAVHASFGSFQGRFVPSYFYPKSVAKPFGYGITQTTYL